MDFLYIFKDLKQEGASKRVNETTMEQNVSIVVVINGETKGFIKTDSTVLNYPSSLSEDDKEAYLIKLGQEYIDKEYNTIKEIEDEK